MLLSILTLIIETVASVLAAVLLLRFWMQAVRVRPPSSVAQFTFQLSDWMVRPLRRVFPGFGGYDWASLIGAFLVAIFLVAIKLWLWNVWSIEVLVVQVVLLLVQWILYGIMGLLLLEVIFSWVNPHAPLAPLVRALNDPLLRPLRRIIPLIGNVDVTIFVAFLLLQIVLGQVSSYILK